MFTPYIVVGYSVGCKDTFDNSLYLAGKVLIGVDSNKEFYAKTYSIYHVYHY